MSWCPKCKTEYIDGIKKCADCDCDLVDEEIISEDFLDESPKSNAKYDYITKSSSLYVKKEEQYKDLKSSGFTFMFFSIIGLIVVLLNVLGILHILNGPLIYIVMTALFVFFLFIGINAYYKAFKVKSLISTENDTSTAISNWLKENITATMVNNIQDDSLSEEVNYFHKTEMIKEKLKVDFENENDSFLDQLIEDFYSENFETNDFN